MCQFCTLPNFSDPYFSDNFNDSYFSDQDVRNADVVNSVNLGHMNRSNLHMVLPFSNGDLTMITEKMNESENLGNTSCGTDDENSQSSLHLSFSNLEGNSEQEENLASLMLPTRKKYHKNVIMGHLNINSIRNKFTESTEIFFQRILDIFIISETKLGKEFSDAQFLVPGYRFYRKDRHKQAGGLLVYIRSDIACRRLPTMETKSTETIAIELQIEAKKWLLLASYKPPKVKDSTFLEEFTHVLDKATVNYDKFILAGDLNFDISEPSKSKPLQELCEIFDMQTLVNEPTCFKSEKGTVIDNFITNRKNMFQCTQTVETGVSDHHKLILTVFKCHFPKQLRKRITYRSYKNFIEKDFLNDIGRTPFHISEIFSEVDDQLYVLKLCSRMFMMNMFQLNKKLLNRRSHLS